MNTLSSLAALSERSDLDKYGNNKLLLFALEIALSIDDIDTVAANSLTDRPGDKKCDLLYVDRDTGKAIIAQSYFSSDISKKEAPSNKASDLNTAVSWLLGKNIPAMPDFLKPAAQELDSALSDGALNTLEIWYVHNLLESPNVQKELSIVKKTAESYIKKNYSEAGIEDIRTIEVGKNILDEWFKSILAPINVSDRLEIPITGGFQTSGDGWEAFTTSLSAKWLHELYNKYGMKLFSANVRAYLGSRKSDKNINYNIKETAQHNPGRFWAYNNGITALVNNWEKIKSKKAYMLIIDGISIVNGAQTTGAIGSIEIGKLGDANILVRFVKSYNKTVVEDIVRYNNMQNKIEASDFRSNDKIQERLRNEFHKIPDAEYMGCKRGSGEDKIKRPPNLIPSNTVAQCLAAFHQEPNIAYNEKGKIWESDDIYSRFFNLKTTARHIIFCYSLLKAIEEIKFELLNIPEEQRTELQRQQIAFYRQRGSTFVLCAAIAKCCEIFLSRAIVDSFELIFPENITLSQAIESWKPIVRICLAFSRYLEDSLKTNLKTHSTIKADIEKFTSFIEATKGSNSSSFNEFSSRYDNSV